ncbi:MAG TPA: transglycosylase domain-containing protein [Candidatus Saccharimonadales bacterium]|nr:transglycosylase domain-containing protein [Candidatus Saccharimonadales bacterium]
MQILLAVIIFVAKILIAIGDAVLFVFHAIINGFKRSYLSLKKQVQKLTTFKLPAPKHVSKPKTRRTDTASQTVFFQKSAKRGKHLGQSFIHGLTKFTRTVGQFVIAAAVFLHKRHQKQQQKLRNRYEMQRKLRELKLKRQRQLKQISYSRFSFLLKFKYFIAGTAFSFVFIFIPMLSLIFLQNLPNPNQIGSDSAQTTKIYDRNGVLLYQIYANQNRTLVTLPEIPKQLQQATIAIEDKNFYSEPGVDVPAIIRSAWADFSGKPLQGGSTLTQQLIKSTLLTPQVSVDRKVKEIILAFWAQRLYTKDQILQLYLNQVPYGGTAWGVEAASETYFGQHVKDLDLAQSAFLAGLPQAPSSYSPYGDHPDLWKKRQVEVLDKMVSLHYVSKQQADDAKAEELSFLPAQTPIHAPHFVMYVKDWLTKKYGLPFVERGGLTVITSLDVKTQDMAQKVVTTEVANDAYLNLTNGAALVTNPKNGDILAMIGSKDYNDPNGGANNLTTAYRQPGSSIKVVTYSAALSHGFTAATILDDSPVAFASAGGPTYAPVNYDGKFHGRVTLRMALANSFNIPAVKTLNQIGVPTMIALAQKMGITNWNDPNKYGLAITLGGAESRMVDMATVYGTLANLGQRVDVNPILKITDYKGNVIEEKPTAIDGKRVLDAGVAYILSNILTDNASRSLEFGPASPLLIPNFTVSVKTGTTDYKRDNWTIGYTPDHLVAVWVGNNDNSPMSQSLASGITGAAPIWHQIMTNLLTGGPNHEEPMPSDIVAKFCVGRTEYFVRGTENSVSCNAPAPISITPTPVAH